MSPVVTVTAALPLLAEEIFIAKVLATVAKLSAVR